MFGCFFFLLYPKPYHFVESSFLKSKQYYSKTTAGKISKTQRSLCQERSSLEADLSNYLGEHGKKANMQVGKKLLNDKKYALLSNHRMLCSANAVVLMLTADLHPFLLLIGMPVRAVLLRPQRGSQSFKGLREEIKEIKNLRSDE